MRSVITAPWIVRGVAAAPNDSSQTTLAATLAQLPSRWKARVLRGPIAREFDTSVAEIERILDRMLPAFDASNQLRAFKRELRRLEDLSGEFFTIAKRDKDRDSAHLVARLNERICAMRGWTAINIHTHGSDGHPSGTAAVET